MFKNACDLYHDTANTQLKRILEESSSLSELLKTAKFEDFPDELPNSAFAAPTERLFPIHTPQHALMSFIFVKEANDEKEIPDFVKIQITDALEAYGIDSNFIDKHTKKDEVKVAAVSEDDFLFPDSMAYPIRNETEIKTSEQKLLKQLSKMSFETKMKTFNKLAKVASQQNVELTKTSYQLGGATYSNKNALVGNLLVREAAAKSQQNTKVAETFAKLAEAVNHGGTISYEMKIKLAKTISKLDEEAGLRRLYGYELHEPMQIVFNTDKVASDDAINLGNKNVSLNKLAQLPPSFYSDVFGKEILSEIAPNGRVDGPQLKTVLATFPTDMKQQLATALKSVGL